MNVSCSTGQCLARSLLHANNPSSSLSLSLSLSRCHCGRRCCASSSREPSTRARASYVQARGASAHSGRLLARTRDGAIGGARPDPRARFAAAAAAARDDIWPVSDWRRCCQSAAPAGAARTGPLPRAVRGGSLGELGPLRRAPIAPMLAAAAAAATAKSAPLRSRAQASQLSSAQLSSAQRSAAEEARARARTTSRILAAGDGELCFVCGS